MPKVVRNQAHAIIRHSSEYEVISGDRFTEIVIRDGGNDFILSIEKSALAQFVADITRPELKKGRQRVIFILQQQRSVV